jgi:hypothetical protein
MKREQVEVGVRFTRGKSRKMWEVVEVIPIQECYYACPIVEGEVDTSNRSWWCLCNLCLPKIFLYIPKLKQVRW